MDLKLINDMKLVEQNRQDLLAALREVGEDVDDEAPLSELIDRIRYVGGYCDIYLACIVRNGDDAGKRRYFSQAEWKAMSVSSQTKYVKIGLALVADGHKLLIAPDDCTVSESDTSTLMQWSTGSIKVPGLKAYGEGSYGAIDDYDSRGNTDTILAYQDLVITEKSYPAATRARAYKASTQSANGYEDDTIWDLPSLGHMVLLMKYCGLINAAFDFFFASGQFGLVSNGYWTSTNFNGAYNVWAVDFSKGILSTQGYVLGIRAVRAVSVIDDL
jgi:hypothetical protein